MQGEDVCYNLYHGGIVDNSVRHYIVIDLSEATQAALVVGVLIKPRLARTCIEGAIVNLTVIAVYTQYVGAKEEGFFFDSLQYAVRRKTC